MTKLNTYLANLAVLNIKIHNLHWNIVGSQFVSVHEYLESEYDKAGERLDEVAELIRISGESPVANLKEYLEISTIKEIETSKEVSIKEALEIVLSDIKLQKELALEIRKEADEADNFPVANAMEDHIEDYNKQIWFVESSLK
ncbi:DNA starvation/stationary phase protection protein [Peptostreptococcus anaerobius]|uniref:Dps family protein n=1 Tax=Peptostreptococcus anaerobius TaxID=1261 RepID=UPI001D096B46|nr:DNA starvation/stationary phase protection protein [Peptostreptococcus anaerobius]MCB6983776.1 DNA starvation/stationary phase protection protein [Peptostreptococcus anaerobius]MCQ5151626.1 DNA starvation/stationary phase protection protein [Peptostreptococcus anaerobius]